MATNRSKISLRATPQKVWDTLTNPELVKRWQYGSDLHTDWQVGSPIRFVAEWQGQTFEQWGTVLEYTPPQRLRYTLFAPRPGLDDTPENYFEMIYTLTPQDDLTQLEIIQEDNRPSAIQEDEQGEENPVLKMLKEVTEAE